MIRTARIVRRLVFLPLVLMVRFGVPARHWRRVAGWLVWLETPLRNYVNRHGGGL